MEASRRGVRLQPRGAANGRFWRPLRPANGATRRRTVADLPAASRNARQQCATWQLCAADDALHSLVRARLADLLWVRKASQPPLWHRIAVDNYRAAASDPQLEIVDREEGLRRAVQIATESNQSIDDALTALAGLAGEALAAPGQRPGVVIRVIPACAGNRAQAPRWSWAQAGHPCVCGEQTDTSLVCLPISGSSLRVRGTGLRRRGGRGRRRVIPACAGNRAGPPATLRLEPGHPCVCGEQTL